MRTVSLSDKELVSNLFSNSIYQNSHLGWLDLWQRQDTDPEIRLFEHGSVSFLLALQTVTEKIYWLHSFYSTKSPSGLDICTSLRTFFTSRNNSVYAISSNNWFSALLEDNGFRTSDHIVQFETSNISIPVHTNTCGIRVLIREDLALVHQDCEGSFPPLWRLSPYELSAGFESANYGRIAVNEHGIHGYILADITEDNCHILRIAVNSDFQNQGVASALIRKLIYDCEKQNIRNFSVNTNSHNSAAISLYQSLNFTPEEMTWPVYHRYL